MTTHNLIANQARDSFSSYNSTLVPLIDKHIDALQGGAPFPDYLYQCGNNHSHGEDAHWTPFQAAAVRYIRTKPTPWDEATEKLVVFLAGIVSHYVADISWHGMENTPFGYGFIQTLGEQNYKCHGELCDVAHTRADTGGEFVAARIANLDFEKIVHWYIPIDDLINIFALIGDPVTKESLIECAIEFGAGSLAIKEAGDLLYAKETGQAPWLQMHYFNTPIGGVDSMSLYTQFMWLRLEKWLQSGPPPEWRDLSVPPKAFSFDLRDFRDRIKVASHLNGIRLEIPSVTNEERKTSPPKGVLGNEERAYFGEAIAHSANSSLGEERKTSPPKGVLGNEERAYFGEAIAHSVNSSLGEIWVFGAPGVNNQQGEVIVQYVDQNRTQTLTFQALKARFGSSVAILDMNKDGFPDLVVSAPSTGLNQIPEDPVWIENGTVCIFFGSPAGFFEFRSVTISAPALTNLGTTLRTIDVNSDGFPDLIIGCPYFQGIPGPQSGAVFVFYSSQDWKSHVTIDDADLRLMGRAKFELFGWDISQTNNQGEFVVSSPGFRNESDDTLGKITWFRQDKEFRSFVFDSGVNSAFGFSVVHFEDHLFVGAPSYNEHGAVVTIKNGTFANIMVGSQRFGGFGRTMATDSHQLYISAPFENRDGGSVYDVHDIDSQSLKKIYSMENKGARCGMQMVPHASGLRIGCPSFSSNMNRQGIVFDAELR